LGREYNKDVCKVKFRWTYNKAMVYNPSTMSVLYLVATPIGNLEDISLRAIRILTEVNLIAAEDTRRTRKLLAAYGIKTPLTSYYEHSRKSKLTYLMNCLGQGDIALVSEAGMPGISDPGYDIVQAAINHGIKISVIPGPSVLPTAVVLSGLPADQLIYLGFLPRRKGERRRLLISIVGEWRTIIALEAPHRLLVSLADINELLGDRKLAVCRELTKVHEEVFRGTVSEAIAHFKEPKGEFTIVINGADNNEPVEISNSIRDELCRFKSDGIPAKEAIARLTSTTRISKKKLYKAWLEII